MEHVFLKKTKRKNSLMQGFTLLEVLIVIAIIGILVSIGLASFSQAQIKSRDARRRGDLKTMQNALEQLYADSTTAEYITGCSNISTTYLPAGLPLDPKTGLDYPVLTCTTSSYCLCADMESETANNSVGSCAYTAPGAKNYYCVSNLQ